MSSRSTMAWTKDNEHWHEELSAGHMYDMDCEGDRCLVLEFDKEHYFENDEHDGLTVIIKPGTALYDMLSNTRFSKEGQAGYGAATVFVKDGGDK